MYVNILLFCFLFYCSLCSADYSLTYNDENAALAERNFQKEFDELYRTMNEIVEKDIRKNNRRAMMIFSVTGLVSSLVSSFITHKYMENRRKIDFKDAENYLKEQDLMYKERENIWNGKINDLNSKIKKISEISDGINPICFDIKSKEDPEIMENCYKSMLKFKESVHNLI